MKTRLGVRSAGQNLNNVYFNHEYIHNGHRLPQIVSEVEPACLKTYANLV